MLILLMVDCAEKLPVSNKNLLGFVYMKYNCEVQCNMERGWAYTVYRNKSVELVGVLTSN
jgi:hypothetical protein